ncbi:hypothetical protein [Myxococcus qinghaiensis]|uniref:hypothetical protein n=1 Tax=Myxococcus qinghaiensis TaxID=2906758 RepID=UPI0020A82269|nr:hypothetical protein [Myxococcus qinghaiensis]MCP3162141.1 hypothetical protein [Myxococcus qinghaiensis]
MSNELMKNPQHVFEVVELDDAMLTNVVGGLADAPVVDADLYCPTTNSGCNFVAGCGGKGA